MLATFIVQGDASTPEVAVWAASHTPVEPLVNALGLHQAFSSFVFVACVVVLGVSTAICSWRRTKVAINRSRMLRGAANADRQSVAASHDLEIACDPARGAPEILSIASEMLGGLGIRTRHREDLLSAVSPWWSVWGSPVFHWALVALIAVIIVGSLQRADGSMALAVGQTKPDAPASYTWLHAGSWHDWSDVHRSIRVDAFEPDYRIGGIDRGAVPTVSVLDATGRVIKTQRVYPNMMLHAGSLSINSPKCGLSAGLALLNPGGAEIGRSAEPIDFSQAAADGTVPLGVLTLTDSAGAGRLRVSVTVPLDRSAGRFDEWIPQQPRAHVVVTSVDGTQVLDQTIKPGEVATLPGGAGLKLLGIGWYSALGVVDDWTTPLLYAFMVVAMGGLAVTVLVRQQLLVATVVEEPDGAKLVMNVRLWRNASTNRGEIESELARALGGDEKGGTS